jgi:hypothetical protein
VGALVHHEVALEGSFLRCGWDLADVYRDRMTIRQLWVRIQALPPDSPLHGALRAEHEKAEQAKRSAALDDVHNRYKPKGARP